MNIETLGSFLGWSMVLNMSILTVWFLVFLFARKRLYALHGQWFKLTPEQFDTIHYAGMAFYKISIFLFNLVPFLALKML